MTFDPSKHPRGNQTTGHGGQFAAKAQTGAEAELTEPITDVDLSDAWMEHDMARARRGLAYINLAGSSLYSIDPQLAAVRIGFNGEDMAITHYRNSGENAWNDAAGHPDIDQMQDMVLCTLNNVDGESAAVRADVGAYMSTNQRAIPPSGWDAGYGFAVVSDAQSALNQVTAAEKEVTSLSLSVIDTAGILAAQKLHHNRPGITTITLSSNDQSELTVTSADAHGQPVPVQDDIQAFADEIGFDPLAPTDQDVRNALEDRLNSGCWSVDGILVTRDETDD